MKMPYSRQALSHLYAADVADYCAVLREHYPQRAHVAHIPLSAGAPHEAGNSKPDLRAVFPKGDDKLLHALKE